MPAETVLRTWTVATWLVAGADGRLDAIVGALRSVGADAVALQSVRRADAEHIADALGQHVAWDLSYYPKTPVFAGSGVGLCMLSPHEIAATESGPLPDRPTSTWSRGRRIYQHSVVRRADHTEYHLLHAVGLAAFHADGAGNRVAITPEQVGVDAARAIEIPDAATLVNAQVERPIATVAPLQATTFEMPWVQGDFPV